MEAHIISSYTFLTVSLRYNWNTVNITCLKYTGTSLAVQWLRLHTSKAAGAGLIPDQGTKIPHAWPKKLKKTKHLVYNLVCFGICVPHKIIITIKITHPLPPPWGFVIALQSSLLFLLSPPEPPSSGPQGNIDLFSFTGVCICLNVIEKKSYSIYSYFVWFLSIITLQSIQVVTCVRSSFHFIGEEYFIV